MWITTLPTWPFVRNYGVFGFSLMAVDYGEVQETIRADNDQGFIDLGTIRPSAFAVGAGYAPPAFPWAAS